MDGAEGGMYRGGIPAGGEGGGVRGEGVQNISQIVNIISRCTQKETLAHEPIS